MPYTSAACPNCKRRMSNVKSNPHYKNNAITKWDLPVGIAGAIIMFLIIFVIILVATLICTKGNHDPESDRRGNFEQRTR